MLKKILLFSIIAFSLETCIFADPVEQAKPVEQEKSILVENQTYGNLLGQLDKSINQAKKSDVFGLLLSKEEQENLKTEAKSEIEKKYKKIAISDSEKENNLEAAIHDKFNLETSYKIKKLQDCHFMFSDLARSDADKIKRVKIQVHTFEDGRFFNGNADKPLDNLFQIFFGPKAETALTYAGQTRASWELANPCAEAKDIIKRQQRVKALLSDPEKFNEIDEILKKIAALEQNWLDVKYRVEREKFRSIFNKEDWIFKTNFDDFEDFVRRTGSRPDDAVFAYFIAKLIALILSRPANNTDFGMLLINVLIPKIFYGGLATMLFGGSIFSFLKARGAPLKDKFILIPTGIVFASIGLLLLKYIQYSMNQIFDAQKQLCKMRQLKDHMEELCVLLGNDFIPSITELERFLDSETENSELNTLLKKIDATTFSNSNSWFSHHGRTIRTYIAFEGLKEKFATAMEVVGEIDFYMAIAKLYQRSKNSANPFSFPEIVQSENTLFELQGMWSPLIGQEIAVPSDICLGVESKNEKIGSVVSGPNYGGKSVYLMEILTTDAFIQSTGIGPCKGGRISPIHEIETYVTIKDNPPKESLFSAQCARLNTFIKSAATADKENIKKLVLIDEPLTGTKVLYAEELVNSIIEELSRYNKTIYVFTTHFDAVIDGLEENSNRRFENRQVLANVDKDGIFISPRFEVGPGKSRVDAALKVAHDRFDQENFHVIDNAKNRILKRINKMKETYKTD